ncbi:olfactory receptor 1019-like [Spea bombifrons]|uniref:olfactory receptor 1019-like n=1 Tax=Spea bombifrons TaxID=233779 RepID=UPI00234A6915|nr:olfactory receptor 1019-like [Spea bombifrons]
MNPYQMELDNITGFIIQGFSNVPELQSPLFVLFLMIYLMILLGNLTIFTVILLNSHLHTPMYIFLLNLSFIDMCFTSTILPNLLHVLFTQHKYISFSGCMVQMYFFVSLACTEYFLLTAMAYDRYLAICHPLHYVLFMSLKNCGFFIAAAWTVGFLDPTGHVVLLAKLSFCGSHVIDHFFCDVSPLLKLSCSDTFSAELMIYIEGVLVTFNSFMLTVTSYFFIISTILKMSSEDRRKAFSTCGSHMTCVVIFYGTIFCLYVRPTSSYSPERDKFFSLFYIVLIPMLNPIIYTLKNKEFKRAFIKVKNRAF